MSDIKKGLDYALDVYWHAKTRSEGDMAYFAILLFGGPDGYPVCPRWRGSIARMLRKLALWVEGR
jgi:hypothetical protein